MWLNAQQVEVAQSIDSIVWELVCNMVSSLV